jgi:hypothetical protein
MIIDFKEHDFHCKINQLQSEELQLPHVCVPNCANTIQEFYWRVLHIWTHWRAIFEDSNWIPHLP